VATLRDIRRSIASVKKTQQITKAMKMVAAAKLRRAQERIEQTRPYADGLAEVLSRVSSKVDAELNPYLQVRNEVRSILFVVVSSDRGLCGSFNTNVFRRARTEIAAAVAAGQQAKVLAVGKKGAEFFAKGSYDVLDSRSGLFRNLQFADALSIADQAVAAFLDGSYDQVRVIYAFAKSVASADVISELALPIAPEAADELEGTAVDYSFEPSPAELLNDLCPRSLNMKIWRALLESYAAEEGARMVAMDSATEAAEEMVANLSLIYNKARQAAITTEISEIVGGAEALK
jgi:F-type H+-transporting ATPase subunit gamma